MKRHNTKRILFYGAGKRFQLLTFAVLFSLPCACATATLGDNSFYQQAIKSNPLKPYLRVRAHEKSQVVNTCPQATSVEKDPRSVQVTCRFWNQSKDTIRSVRGVLCFKTYHGQTVHEMVMNETVTLDPGENLLKVWQLKRADFKDEGSFKSFLETPLSRLRQVWLPSEVRLVGGKILKP
jgi:hypothetical protein